MTEPVLISNFNLPFPYKDTLRRLGYSASSEPDTKTSALIKHIADEAYIHIHPKGLYRICEIKPEPGCIQIENHILKSIYLHNLLKNCNIAAVMAVTIGSAICDLISKYMINEPSKGVVLDAIASELADTAMEKLHSIISSMGLQKGYRTTIRYSPGYKDFSLKEQAVFDDLLNLKRIGLEITSSCILKPEKSITAIAGWEKIYE